MASRSWDLETGMYFRNSFTFFIISDTGIVVGGGALLLLLLLLLVLWGWLYDGHFLKPWTKNPPTQTQTDTAMGMWIRKNNDWNCDCGIGTRALLAKVCICQQYDIWNGFNSLLFCSTTTLTSPLSLSTFFLFVDKRVSYIVWFSKLPQHKHSHSLKSFSLL